MSDIRRYFTGPPTAVGADPAPPIRVAADALQIVRVAPPPVKNPVGRPLKCKKNETPELPAAVEVSIVSEIFILDIYGNHMGILVLIR